MTERGADQPNRLPPTGPGLPGGSPIRTGALTIGVFLLATWAVWTTRYFIRDLTEGHASPAIVLVGLTNTFGAVFFVGVPTVGIIGALVYLGRGLPVVAFRVIAVVGLMLPLGFLPAVSTVSPLKLYLTQAIAQALTSLFLIYQTSARPARAARTAN